MVRGHEAPPPLPPQRARRTSGLPENGLGTSVDLYGPLVDTKSTDLQLSTSFRGKTTRRYLSAYFVRVKVSC